MSNYLKMDIISTIRALRDRKWSQRRIARELGIDRGTVAKHSKQLEEEEAKPAGAVQESEEPGSKPATNSTPGFPDSPKQNQPNSTLGNLLVSEAVEQVYGKPGPVSKCEAHAEAIRAKLELGLTAQRIYQDLVCDVGFAGSYQAVKRFIRRLEKSSPVPIERIEVQPGEEAQVDFGSGAPVIGDDGRRRRPWIFRIVLSYSRKGYSEAVWHQNTETFIRCLENAFRHFGGVPKTLNVDNLKAAVIRADWYDPELNPKLDSFCRHYGTFLMPCRPKKAEHKGKVERNIRYVKSNALQGRTFTSLAEENRHLADWERTVADLRIHGTTRKQVAALYAEEKKALLPLPPDLYPCFQEAKRTVHRDSYVEVDKAYYRVSAEHIGRTVWVRWDSRCVRIFNHRWEQIRLHTKLAPGQFTEVHGIGGGRGTLEENLAYWLERASQFGQPCADWAQGLVQRRGPTAIRSLIGLIGLTDNHSFKALNRACACALSRGAWRLRDIRCLLDQAQPSVQTHFQFAQDHPLIRNLAEYGLFIESKTNES